MQNGLIVIRLFNSKMSKTKEQKKEIVERLADAFKNSASSVFVHFKGLTVGEETEMRGDMQQDGLSYFVARKTLMKRAWEDVGAQGDAPELEGEIAVAYGTDDPTAAARGIHAFVQKFKDKLSIVGGIYEGGFKDASGMNEIATIPPLETLRGMFVNVINSPIQGLAVALNQIAQKKS